MLAATCCSLTSVANISATANNTIDNVATNTIGATRRRGPLDKAPLGGDLSRGANLFLGLLLAACRNN